MTVNAPDLWYPDDRAWIEWAGGENPVPGKMVEVLFSFSRRMFSPGTSKTPSEGWIWDHDDCGSDIVAYLVVDEAGDA